jgi:hypothetical protein
MTFEEYWDSTVDNELPENYAGLMQQLQERLPAGVEEKYDIVELLIEIIADCERARKYEEIVALYDLMKATQSEELVNEAFLWIFDALSVYYCYQDREQALRALVNVPDDMMSDYDLVNRSRKIIIYYNYLEVAHLIFETNYQKVADSEELLPSALDDLERFKFDYEVEKAYVRYLETGAFSVAEVLEKCKSYGVEFEEALGGKLEQYIIIPPEKRLPLFLEKFAEDRLESISLLMYSAIGDLSKAGINLLTSHTIWAKLFAFWEENRKGKKIDAYFRLNEDKFKLYLRSISGMMMDYRFEAAMVLWGSAYAYDYLHSVGIIREEDYISTLETIAKLKQLLINENQNDLWKYSFVHKWQPSARQTTEEQAAEQALFQEYFDEPFTGESENGFFLETDKEHEARMKELYGKDWKAKVNRMNATYSDLFNELADPAQPESDDERVVSAKPKPAAPPKLVLPKIGRNERVTVKYEDGQVKADVKFKTVIRDLEAGKCKLV